MANSLSETIIQIIGGLQNTNFEVLWLWFIGYLVFMWVIASVWVFFDAKQRYKSILLVTLISLFVAICNLPALILYVMLRPEHTKEELELFQEGLTNIFIKNGKLLNAPEVKEAIKVPEKKEQLSQIDETIDLKNNENKIIKNENDEIEISTSFLQSLQISFEIIFYTISTFCYGLIDKVRRQYYYWSSIKIEFNEMSVGPKSNTKISNDKVESDEVVENQLENITKTQKNIRNSEKKTRENSVKTVRKQKTISKKDLSIPSTRKKIPPVKFVLK